MQRALRGGLAAMAIVSAGVAATAFAKEGHVSPYAGETAREIKALSPDYLSGLRAGAGLGFAKSAELNGYPGPAHLLELAEAIPLKATQTAAIQGIFERMQAEAIALGAELIEAERRIEGAFRDRSIDEAGLARLTAAAGAANARLRARHLAAHLEAAALLSHPQIAAYERLRGYEGGAAHGRRHHQ